MITYYLGRIYTKNKYLLFLQLKLRTHLFSFCFYFHYCKMCILLEFEHTLGDSEGQGNLLCCSPWGHKESDMIQLLNNSRRWIKKDLAAIYVGECLLMFSSKSFMVPGLSFRSLTHFEFIYVCSVRECSNFTVLHVATQFSQHTTYERDYLFSILYYFLLCHRLSGHRCLVYIWAFYSVLLI